MQLPEKCPHSSAVGARPERCSLCVSEAMGLKPRVVTIDAETRTVKIDGVPEVRPIDNEVAHLKPRNADAPRKAGRRAPQCSRCGSTEHMKPKCDGSGTKIEAGTASMRASDRKAS